MLDWQPDMVILRQNSAWVGFATRVATMTKLVLALLLQRVALVASVTTTQIGDSIESPFGIAVTNDHTVYVGTDGGAVIRIANDGATTTLKSGIGAIYGVAIGPEGDALYLSNVANHVVQRYDLATTTVTEMAGSVGSSGYVDASGSSAKFNSLFGNSVAPNSRKLYLGDKGNNLVRRGKAPLP